jgi:GNAT superfamily N-acetyltransferase
MNPEVIINRLTASECVACSGLLAQQLTEHDVSTSPEPLAKLMRQLVEQPDHGFVLTAKMEGALVGLAYVAYILSAEHCGKEAWLEELFVLPAFRGRGIGESLLDATLETAAGEGARAVDLEIDSGHDRVASLHRRSGFTALNRSRWFKTL